MSQSIVRDEHLSSGPGQGTASRRVTSCRAHGIKYHASDGYSYEHYWHLESSSSIKQTESID
eukprot:3711356-Pleurochrysis_carterae.AAC.3